MTTDPIAGIYHRHMNVLSAVSVTDDDVRLHLIGFSLKLAMAEYAEELARMAQPSADCVDQQIAEHNAAQIERLNEWMAEYAPAEYVSPDDTGTCVLRLLGELRKVRAEALWNRRELDAVADERDASDLRCAELEVEIADLKKQLTGLVANKAAQEQCIRNYQGDVASLRAQLAAAVPTVSGNGAGLLRDFDGVVVNPPTVAATGYPLPILTAEEAAQQAGVAAPSWHDKVRMAFAADTQMLEWYDSIHAGRNTFRQLPKPVRWQLIAFVISSLRNPESGEWPALSEFDKLRPGWMPTGAAIVVTFGNGKWQSIIDKVVGA